MWRVRRKLYYNVKTRLVTVCVVKPGRRWYPLLQQQGGPRQDDVANGPLKSLHLRDELK